MTIDIPPQVNKEYFKVIFNNCTIFEYRNLDNNTLHFVKKNHGFKELNSYESIKDMHKGNGLLDVYLDPLRIISCVEGDENIDKTVNAFSEPYTNGFESKIYIKYPIYSIDETYNKEEVRLNNSLVVVDNNVNHTLLETIRAKNLIQTDSNGYEYNGERVEGSYCIMQIVPNPWNDEKNILYINTNDISLYKKNVFTRKVIMPTYINGFHPFWNNDALIYDGKKFYTIYEFGMENQKV